GSNTSRSPGQWRRSGPEPCRRTATTCITESAWGSIFVLPSSRRRSVSFSDRRLVMKTHPLAITLSVAFLTCAAIPALAQQPPGGSMMPQAGQKQTEQSSPDHGGMMGGGMMGRGGMSQGMMGHRGMMNPIAVRIIFALMDTDGDGTVSLQE